MPRGDGTGPVGAGPMSGRGAGLCSGYRGAGLGGGAPWCGMGRGLGRGARRGLAGGGFGWRAAAGQIPVAPLTPAEQGRVLKEEKAFLERRLEAVEGRLKELDDGDK